MLSELKTGSRVVGAKQARRAILDGRARLVFLAMDAENRVTAPLEKLCREKSVPVDTTHTMSELGAACSIAVGSAVAVLLN